MKHSLLFAITASAAITFIGCSKEDDDPTPAPAAGPQLKFTMAFDPTLPRLGNFGEAVAVPSGNAAQSPDMQEVSVHYIEFAPDSLTPLGAGSIVYQGPETNAGGANAVDFNQVVKAGQGEQLLAVNLSNLPAGTYNWLRVSLTYQRFKVDYRFNAPPLIVNEDLSGTVASFVGFNTYITSHTIQDSTVILNENKLQGYWAFETGGTLFGQTFGQVLQGDGAGVTVVNPIAATSPVPAGSCVVTGKLASPLVVTGSESSDVEVVLAFSINDSFEWVDSVADGKFEPGAGETVVDMGLRGLHPYVAP